MGSARVRAVRLHAARDGVELSGGRRRRRRPRDAAMRSAITVSTRCWTPRRARPCAQDGAILVLTPFACSASPLVWFATGDCVAVLEGCSCGRPGPFLQAGTVERLDFIVKIRGVNVWPEALDAALFTIGQGCASTRPSWRIRRRRARAAQGPDRACAGRRGRKPPGGSSGQAGHGAQRAGRGRGRRARSPARSRTVTANITTYSTAATPRPGPMCE